MLPFIADYVYQHFDIPRFSDFDVEVNVAGYEVFAQGLAVNRHSRMKYRFQGDSPSNHAGADVGAQHRADEKPDECLSVPEHPRVEPCARPVADTDRQETDVCSRDSSPAESVVSECEAPPCFQEDCEPRDAPIIPAKPPIVRIFGVDIPFDEPEWLCLRGKPIAPDVSSERYGHAEEQCRYQFASSGSKISLRQAFDRLSGLGDTGLAVWLTSTTEDNGKNLILRLAFNHAGGVQNIDLVLPRSMSIAPLREAIGLFCCLPPLDVGDVVCALHATLRIVGIDMPPCAKHPQSDRCFGIRVCSDAPIDQPLHGYQPCPIRGVVLQVPQDSEGATLQGESGARLFTSPIEKGRTGKVLPKERDNSQNDRPKEHLPANGRVSWRGGATSTGDRTRPQKRPLPRKGPKSNRARCQND